MMERFVEELTKIWNAIKRGVIKVLERLKIVRQLESKPNQVMSMHDFIERKKQSEPFYKAARKNRKHWE